jgi:hypothetical protein
VIPAEQLRQALPVRAQPLRALVLCLALAALAASIPFMERPGLWAIAAGMLTCVIVPAWNDWRHGKLDVFEPIHVVGLVYFLYFGLGALWVVGNPELAYDAYLPDHVPRAALYVLLGYLGLLFGYYGLWGGRRAVQRDEPVGSTVLLLWVPAVLGLVGSLAAIIHHDRMLYGMSLSVITSSLSQFSPLFLFAWALIWLLFWSGRLHFRQQLLWALFVPGVLVTLFKTFSNKTVIMFMCVIPIIALWYVRKRIPWKSLTLLMGLLIFVVFPLYNTYRVTDIRAEHTKRMELTYQLLQDWDREEYVKRSWGTFKARVTMISSVAVVVRDTPRWVPFAKGETVFLPTLTYFIPRVIWPDKPIQAGGREFAVKFRITNDQDRSTFIACTVPGEMYWNFGLAGVLLGMMLFGVLMRWVYRRYGESQAVDPQRRALYIVMLLTFLQFDGGVANSLVTMVRTILAVEILRWISRVYGRQEVSPARIPANLLARPEPQS